MACAKHCAGKSAESPASALSLAREADKQTNHFRMEFEEPQPICIDGEISNAKSVEFTVVPGAFNFVIPKGSALRFPKK